MSSFFENIPMAIVVSACSMLVSLLALFYARKNLKMQKYIDVVTAQRIKWIGELRADFSAILSYVYLSTYVEDVADKWQFYIDECSEEFNGDDEGRYSAQANIKRLRHAKTSESTPENYAEFIRRIDLCILKLNPSDSRDEKLIKDLENFKLVPYDHQSKTLKELLMKIRNMMSEILKCEWERVKKEVRKGGLVKKKRKNIFD